MALLNFYKGQYASLPAARVEGNVYITTDERAMYVDIGTGTEEAQRIRLGQIVTFDTFAAFKTFLGTHNPPYSQEAFYYIADKNALLRWTASTGTTGSDEDEISGTWVQINTVSDVQANITALTSRVAANETAIKTLNTAVGDASSGLVKDVADLKTSVTNAQETADKGVADAATAQKTADEAVASAKTNAENIASNTSAIGVNTGNITTLTGRMDNAENEIDTLQDVVGDATSGLVQKVNSLDSTVNDATTGLVKKVADLGSKDGELQSAIDTNKSGISKNAEDIAKNAEDIANLQKAVGTDAEGLATKVSDLTDRMTTAEGEIDTLQTDVDAVEEVVAGHTTAIDTINGTGEGSIAKALTDAKTYTDEKVATINNTTNGLDTRLTTAEGNITSLDNRMTDVEKQATDNKSAIEVLNGDTSESVKGQIATAKSELSDQITKSINAANAMEYQKNIGSYDELPIADVKIGDTYVVSTKFTYNDEVYHAGDMLIANGDEDEETGTITAASLTWDHVVTGYVKEQDDKLDVQSNVLMLKNYLGDVNGQVEFESAGQTEDGKDEAGMVVTLTNMADGKSTFNIAMQWGTF